LTTNCPCRSVRWKFASAFMLAGTALAGETE
jgi:hypothetical protein